VTNPSDGATDGAKPEYPAKADYEQSKLRAKVTEQLFKDGLVSLRDALSVATQPEDLRIALQQAEDPPVYRVELHIRHFVLFH